MFVFEVLYFTQRRSICIIPVNKSRNAILSHGSAAAIEYFATQDAVCKGNRHASKPASGGALAHPHAGWQLAVALTVATACKSTVWQAIELQQKCPSATPQKPKNDWWPEVEPETKSFEYSRNKNYLSSLPLEQYSSTRILVAALLLARAFS